jgi:hypothetical protein
MAGGQTGGDQGTRLSGCGDQDVRISGDPCHLRFTIYYWLNSLRRAEESVSRRHPFEKTNPIRHKDCRTSLLRLVDLVFIRVHRWLILQNKANPFDSAQDKFTPLGGAGVHSRPTAISARSAVNEETKPICHTRIGVYRRPFVVKNLQTYDSFLRIFTYFANFALIRAPS